MFCRLKAIILLGLSLALTSVTNVSTASEPRLHAVVLDRFTGNLDWTMSSQRGTVGSSRFKQSSTGGRLRFDFTQSPGYVGIRKEVFIPGNPVQFEIQAYKSLFGHPLVLRLKDSQGEFYQSQLLPDKDTASSGVQKYIADWTDADAWFHYGGDEDGVPDLPLYVSEIILDDAHNSADKGEVILLQLSTIALTKREDCLRLTFPDGDYLFLADEADILERCQLPIYIDNLLPEEMTVQAELEIVNADLTTMGHNFWTITVPPLSRLEDHIYIDPNRRGAFTLIVSGVGPKTIRQPFAIAARRERSPTAAESPFGMGIYLGNRYSSEQRRQAAEYAAQAGIKWSREEFSWALIQPSGPDEWDWRRYDDAVKVARNYDIQLLGLLDYATSWSSSAPMTAPDRSLWLPDLNAWKEYNRRTVTRYGKSIKHWEIWNEPNGVFWRPGPKPEEYFRLLKASWETIKEVDPEAKVLGLSTAGTDFHFIEEVLKLGGGDYFDIIAVHPYRYPSSPEQSDFLGEMERLHTLLTRYGCDKPVWITEMGWPSHQGPEGVSESIQAAMLVRTYVTAYASGLVDKVFWYDFRNDGVNPMDKEQNFGILNQDFSPKPAYLAYMTMTENISGRVFDGTVELGLGPGIHGYAFGTGADRILMLWSEEEPTNAVLGLSSTPFVYQNLWGRKRLLIPQDGKVVLPISQEPLFLSQFKDFPDKVTDSVTVTPDTGVELCQGDDTDVDFILPGFGKQGFVGNAFIEAFRGIQLNKMVVPLDVKGDQLVFQVNVQAASDVQYGTCLINADYYCNDEWFGQISREIQTVQPVEIEVLPEVRESKGIAVRLTNRLEKPLPVRLEIEGFPNTAYNRIPIILAPSGEHVEFFRSSAEVDESALYPITITVERAGSDPIVKRSRVSLATAARLFSPPILDGDLGDWHRVDPIVLKDESQIREFSSGWGGPEDLSATAYVAWDSENLYVAAKVLDGTFSQTFQEGDIWRGDSVQFAIAPLGSEDYAEVGLALTDSGPVVWRWHDMQGITSTVLKEGHSLIERSDVGMVYECSIPWSALNMEPSRGDVMRFEVMVNDNDGTGRRGWIEWSGGIGQNKTADAFGTLTLR